MIAPTPRAVLALGLGFPCALLPALLDARWGAVWPAFLLVYAAALLVDAIAALPPGRLRHELAGPATLYLGDPDAWSLTLTVSGARGVRARGTPVRALLEHTEPFPPDEARTLTVSPDAPATAAVNLAPRRRGTGRLEALWLTWTGPLGLVRRTERRPLEDAIAVVPNVRAVRAAAVRLFRSQEYLSGTKVVHHIGDGSEFEHLRDFVPGLDHRTMNWKHSARDRKLICTEHRAERNHQIVLALDTGRLMGEPLGGIPKLDHAINAALLLAYYSLRAGDRVGLFAFDDEVRLFAPPAAGVHAFGRLQHHTAALAYGPHETNFTLGLTTLATRLKRRSLIIVITDFVDTTTALLMAENLQRLGRRHLVLFASLQDPLLLRWIRAEPGELPTLHRAVVADDLLRERETVVRTLQRAGILVLDTAPEGLSTGLLNRYLEIRRRELV